VTPSDPSQPSDGLSSTAAADSRHPPTADGRPLRILILKDSAEEADLLLLALDRGGLQPVWERVESDDGLRAALAARPWDVVVSDYALPGFGAPAALAVVREADPDLPFIVVSGAVGEDAAVELMQASASDYILKHDLDRLAPAVEREVREAGNRRAIRTADRAAAHLAAVVESSDDAIVSKTLDGVITSWNRAAERLYGWTAAEAVGRNVSFLIPPDKADEWAGNMGRLRADEPVGYFETVRLHRDGHRIDVAMTMSAVRGPDGRMVGFSKTARDIRDRKRAEEALRTSEERYRSLADAMPQIVWSTTQDGYHEFFNRQWYDYTGLTFEQSQGEEWYSVFHPDDRPLVRERWQHSLSTGDPYEVEYRCRSRDGEYRWFLGRALPQRDADGTIVRWFGTGTDIHDFKQAQADRDAALARLDLQVERMPLAYMTTDATFRCTRWNPAAERTFGFPAAEVLGRHPFEILVPPSARPHVADLLARLRAGDMNVHGTNENVTKDGRVITCEWHNTPLFGPDGTFEGHLALAQDVTDRKEAERALHLRDRAIQAVVAGILITDPNQPDNPITFASPGFERMTGYSQEELLGRNCRFLQGKDTDPSAVARVRAAIRGKEACAVELLNYRKDGTPFWNALSIAPIRDDAGRLTHFVGVQTDVTARRGLEEQFRQAQKMEAFGQLAGGVAHDFNNLLTIINGYSELLLHRLPPTDPSRELAAEIYKAGERSAALTRQLLAFSRRQVLAPRVLDLNAVVGDTDRMLRRLLGEDLRLATALAPDLWAVRADAGQVEQVLMNLAVNARDAMPTGGRLTIETRNVELDAGYARARPGARPGPHVLLSVTDTGSGMTPAVKARVFEPFFTTKEPGKGTGLGLATVYGIVQQSGGHVAVYSEVGVGTSVKVYLPRVESAAGGSKVLPGLLVPPRGTETVLLVEDEAGVRALTRHVLAGCGYAVLEAADGAEAVRLAAGHGGPIHLLVTDVVMPGTGGRAVAEQVAASHPRVRVLYMSGYTDDAVVRHGVLQEGVNFLQKPFSPAALAFKVREVLDAPSIPGDRCSPPVPNADLGGANE
jgi:two-component system cell cycle sensor histidine kinase/response regulator CckA